MKSGALGGDLISDERIPECNATITADHARREWIFQIVEVQDERASFANTIVDVSPDSDFLNTIHDESMRLHVIGIICILRDNFGPVLRHYEVTLQITSAYLW